MGDAFEKSGQNAAQRRKGGVVLEPHKNSFPKNSLLIIDEEQHFGVAHKEKLKSLKSDVQIGRAHV